MKAVMRFLRRLWFFGSDAEARLDAQKHQHHDHHGSLRAAGWTGDGPSA